MAELPHHRSIGIDHLAEPKPASVQVVVDDLLDRDDAVREFRHEKAALALYHRVLDRVVHADNRTATHRARRHRTITSNQSSAESGEVIERLRPGPKQQRRRPDLVRRLCGNL